MTILGMLKLGVVGFERLVALMVKTGFLVLGAC